MKTLIKNYITQNYQIITLALAFLLLPIMFRNSPEDIRMKNISDSQKHIEVLSWSISEKKKELENLDKQIIHWTECLKQNSFTGTLVDCDSIKETLTPTITTDIPVASESKNTASKPALTTDITPRDKLLMSRVCLYGVLNWKTSPLCNNWKLYYSLKSISQSKWVPFEVALGITYAESHIGIDYNKPACSSYNNWGWVKGRVTSNGKVTPWKYPDNNWCYLYRFDSIEDYWDSKMNLLKVNYLDKWCQGTKQVSCIATWYVGKTWTLVGKQPWINRVVMIAE